MNELAQVACKVTLVMPIPFLQRKTGMDSRAAGKGLTESIASSKHVSIETHRELLQSRDVYFNQMKHGTHRNYRGCCWECS